MVSTTRVHKDAHALPEHRADRLLVSSMVFIGYRHGYSSVIHRCGTTPRTDTDSEPRRSVFMIDQDQIFGPPQTSHSHRAHNNIHDTTPMQHGTGHQLAAHQSAAMQKRQDQQTLTPPTIRVRATAVACQYYELRSVGYVVVSSSRAAALSAACRPSRARRSPVRS